MCTPLTMKITMRMRGLETLKEYREVELDACFHTLNDRRSTGLNVAKMKVIPRPPNEKFTNVKSVDKNTRSSSQFSRIQIKEGVTNKQNRRHRAIGEHQIWLRLDDSPPGDAVPGLRF